jgi:hypothetical protein
LIDDDATISSSGDYTVRVDSITLTAILKELRKEE